MRFRVAALLAALLTVLLPLFSAPASADSLQVFGAGSLTSAFADLLRRFPAAPDTLAPAEFGPSGLLRERLERGAAADVFASADMAQARRLAVGHPERLVINFTRNRMCAVARERVGLTAANMLERLLDPAVRVATSTPGADPGGDYAWALFAQADKVRPGARAALEAKALKLVGGGAATPLLVPGKGAVEGVFLADRADVMLGYCSGAAELMAAVPGLVSVPAALGVGPAALGVGPAALGVGPAYGMVLLNAKPVTLRFAAFVMSEAGQAVLAAHGFDPVGVAAPGAAVRGVLVQRAGKGGQVLTPERLAGLPRTTQEVTMTSEHGVSKSAWSGPLLWDVLVASGAVDPAKPGEQVRLVVRVTGADGYSAVVALGELAPEFGGRPVLLADEVDGKPVPGGLPRLVVPAEKRGGRSVRDVVRVDVE